MFPEKYGKSYALCPTWDENQSILLSGKKLDVTGRF
jgi:hypothetical protein